MSLELGWMPLGHQPVALLLELEEQLAPSPGGAQAHEAEVVEQEPEDHRPDPVLGVRAEPDLAAGIVPRQGLDEADVALLDQVQHVRPLAVVLERDLDDQGAGCW
jgi:hypothetical protein